LENWEPGPVVEILKGWSLDPAALADGQWHHLVLQLSSNSAEAYLDGASLALHPSFPAQNIPTFNFSDVATAGTAFHLGSFGPFSPTLDFHINNPQFAGGAHGPRTNLPASLDRLRAYSRKLTADDVLALYQTDIDRDQLRDLTEHRSLLHRDHNGNGQLDPGETDWLLNPFRYDAPTLDHDQDGLVSLVEQEGNLPAHGPTDPANPDTDGDQIPDGWESDHGLDPLSAEDADDDPDGDNLTNSQEFLAGTDPNELDSDDDGIPDNLDTPPLWVSIQREAVYDYDDYEASPSGQTPQKHFKTEATWPNANPTNEALEEAKKFNEIDNDLAAAQAFPGTFPDESLSSDLFAQGKATIIANPPCYHADLEARQIAVQIGYDAPEAMDFKALVVTEHTVDGVESDPEVEIITLTIPQGAQISNTYDLEPEFALTTTGAEFAGTGTEPDELVYGEEVKVNLLPVEFKVYRPIEPQLAVKYQLTRHFRRWR
jgi:hypothetical protein